MIAHKAISHKSSGVISLHGNQVPMGDRQSKWLYNSDKDYYLLISVSDKCQLAQLNREIWSQFNRIQRTIPSKNIKSFIQDRHYRAKSFPDIWDLSNVVMLLLTLESSRFQQGLLLHRACTDLNPMPMGGPGVLLIQKHWTELPFNLSPCWV